MLSLCVAVSAVRTHREEVDEGVCGEGRQPRDRQTQRQHVG